MNVIEMRAKDDVPTRMRISSINRAYRDFESILTSNRIVLARAFHEVRSAKTEVAAMTSARNREQRGELNTNDYSAIINMSHEHAFESFRDAASAMFLLIIDGLVSSLWYRLGLPSGQQRGGAIITSDVTMLELFDLAGNYLRHRHEWWSAPDLQKPKAQHNIRRLEICGLPYIDPLLAGRIVDLLPFETYLSIEIELLEVADFLAFACAKHIVRQWAGSNNESYVIPYGAYDEQHVVVFDALLNQYTDRLGRVASP